MESAEELRRAVLGQWCGGASLPGAPTEHKCSHCRPPLWTRAPSLRPEGLEWATTVRNEYDWCLSREVQHALTTCAVEPQIAAALIRDSLAVALAKAWKHMTAKHRQYIEALASDSVAELAGLMHRLLDSLPL